MLWVRAVSATRGRKGRLFGGLLKDGRRREPGKGRGRGKVLVFPAVASRNLTLLLTREICKKKSGEKNQRDAKGKK